MSCWMAGQPKRAVCVGHTVAPIHTRAYHKQASGHQTLPLLVQGFFVLAEEGLPQHEGQQDHKAEPHMACGQKQRKPESIDAQGPPAGYVLEASVVGRPHRAEAGGASLVHQVKDAVEPQVTDRQQDV